MRINQITLKLSALLLCVGCDPASTETQGVIMSAQQAQLSDTEVASYRARLKANDLQREEEAKRFSRLPETIRANEGVRGAQHKERSLATREPLTREHQVQNSNGLPFGKAKPQFATAPGPAPEPMADVTKRYADFDLAVTNSERSWSLLSETDRAVARANLKRAIVLGNLGEKVTAQ